MLGREALGEVLIAELDLTLLELEAASRRASLSGRLGRGGSIPGKGTLFDSVLPAAGAVNIANGEGGAYESFGIEQLNLRGPTFLPLPQHHRYPGAERDWRSILSFSSFTPGAW